MVSKVEGSYTTADVSYRKAETIERKIEPIETQIDILTQTYHTISQEITDRQTENIEHNSTVLSGLSNLEIKLKNIDTAQEILRTKITDLEEQLKKLASAPPPQPQIATEIILPPIPIKRDKALAALTDTEIQVLEMLSKEGSKTAPEIKEHVQLSREHTARLMKKLYEDGYLEREANKLPFRYSIKKEMEALLQKVENTPI